MNKEDVKRYLVLIAKYWRLLRKGVGKVWRKINPLQFLSRLDRYIMAKFIGCSARHTLPAIPFRREKRLSLLGKTPWKTMRSK